jgi:regulator of protease activity HflC (stomatin/prohibitin superfamily)
MIVASKTARFVLLVSLLTATTVNCISWSDVGIVGGVATACIGFSCLKIVTTGNECLVERFGKFHRKLSPGYHFVARPFEGVSYQATTREQVMDVPPQQCYTLDNAPIKADAVIYLRILSLEAARYNVNDLKFAILNLCLTQLREAVGKLTLDQTFSSRERINSALLKVMNDVCHTWGVQVTRVEIQNLEPSQDILAAMELQMAAERHKRAAILKSEGERTKLINEAEGNARANVVAAEAKQESIVRLAQAEATRLQTEAEGIQKSILAIAAAIKDESNKSENATTEAIDKAVQVMMLNRYLEAQSKVAESPGAKVLMFPTKDSMPITYEGLQSLLK